MAARAGHPIGFLPFLKLRRSRSPCVSLLLATAYIAAEVHMSPRTITDRRPRDAPPLHADDTLGDAVRRLLDSGLPALPVVDERRALRRRSSASASS